MNETFENISKDNESFKDKPFTFNWYLNLFSKNYSLTAQMILSSLILQFLALGLPIFYIVIFDRVFGRQNLAALDVMAVGMIMVLVVDFIVKILRSQILSHFVELINKNSLIFYINSLKLSFNKFLKRNDSKKAVGRLSELFNANLFLAQSVLVSSLDAVFSVFILAVLFFMSPKLAFIAVFPVIPIALLVFFKSPRQKEKALNEKSNEIKSKFVLSEFINNSETIKSSNSQDRFAQSIFSKINTSVEGNFGVTNDKIFANADLNFIINLGSFAVLYFGAHDVLQGHISFGIYLAISIIGRNFVSGIQKVLVSIQKLMESLVVIDDVKNMMQFQENQSFSGIKIDDFSGNIRFENVSFSYSSNLPKVLDSLSFEINSGEKIVITGKNGAGKTTLVRLMQGLLNSDEGIIEIDNKNIISLCKNDLNKNIGTALQAPGMFSGSIRDNITLFNDDISVNQIMEACSIVELDSLITSLPDGLDTKILSMGMNLSGGQRAKIALARVLLNNPQMLVLDEATSMIDAKQNEQIYSKIFELYKDKTCIFITNNLNVHKKADRILVLHSGKIAEKGVFDDLIESRHYYYNLHINHLALR